MFAAQLVIKVLSFAFSVLIVRQLGAEAFGQYAAIGAFGMLFIFVADLGLSVFAVREVARYRAGAEAQEKTNWLYANLLVLRLVLSFIASLLILGTAWLTNRPPLMLLALALNAVGLILHGLQGAGGVILGGYERMDVGAAGTVLNQIVFIVLGGLALWWGAGYFGLIVANLVAILVTTGWVLWFVWRLGIRPGRVTPAHWLPLLRTSLPFGIVAFTLGFSYKFDTVLLNVTRSDAETGLYSAVYNLIFSFVILSNIINTALYPTLSKLAQEGAYKLNRVYEQTLRYLFMVSLPITVGTFLLAENLVPFLFEAEYAQAAAALKILIWVLPLMYLSESLGYIIVIANQEQKVARSVLVSTSVNVLANLLLIPAYGYLAAAVMTVLTEAVLVGQYVWLLRERLFSMQWNAMFLRPLIASLGMGLVVSLLPVEWHFIIKIVLGSVVYVGLAFAFGLIGAAELRLIKGSRDSWSTS
jgi:O-antigen/teichoic acid export membrane protein